MKFSQNKLTDKLNGKSIVYSTDESTSKLELDFLKEYQWNNFEKSRRIIRQSSFNSDTLGRLLSSLKNPHKDYKSIHVAGTIGKGSVTTYIARYLQSIDNLIGLYTSPHLENIFERIQINEKWISKVDFSTQWSAIQNAGTYKSISFFDALTAIAMLYFSQKKIDYAVFETGLGGRLDSTNVLSPELTIITRVAFDHQSVLGSSLEKIAIEKAGIIKKGVPLYSCEQEPVVVKILEQTCEKNRCELKIFKSGFDPRISFQDYQEMNKQFANWIYTDYFNCGSKTIDAQIKGRLELMHRSPYVYFDSAHNMASMHSLLDWLKTKCKLTESWNLYFNITKDRDIKEWVERLNLLCKSLALHRFKLFFLDFSKEEDSFHERHESIVDLIDVTYSNWENILNNTGVNHLVFGSMKLYRPLVKILESIKTKATQ